MKLLCVLQPNEGGYVQASFGTNERDTKNYLFEKDENGDLVQDVEDQDHIATLLSSGNFIPYEAHDYDAAAEILDSGNADETDKADEVETELVGDGAPVEALTPASSRKPRKQSDAVTE